jgi:hypothetical protein
LVVQRRRILSALFDWFASLMGLPKAEAAQVIASLFGSSVALIAAVAAWMAARAAKLSVDETKEARLQSLRPYFDVSISAENIVICWRPDKKVRVFVGRASPGPTEGEPPKLQLANIGPATARNIIAKFSYDIGGNISSQDFDRIKKIFSLGGINASETDKFYQLETWGSHSYFKTKTSLQPSTLTFDLCQSNQVVSGDITGVLSNLIFEIALEGLSRPDLSDRLNNVKIVKVLIGYESPLGETFSKHYSIAVRSTHIAAWDDDNWEHDAPKNEWKFLQVELGLGLSVVPSAA